MIDYNLDEPDPCGKPDILDWSPNHAELAWDPPAYDGGAPITHYVIEMKEKNMGPWVEGKTLTVKVSVYEYLLHTNEVMIYKSLEI